MKDPGNEVVKATRDRIVTRMDTPKYGETLKIVYIKYQPILVSLTKGLPSLIAAERA